jgi:hypothetical protein
MLCVSVYLCVCVCVPVPVWVCARACVCVCVTVCVCQRRCVLNKGPSHCPWTGTCMYEATEHLLLSAAIIPTLGVQSLFLSV